MQEENIIYRIHPGYVLRPFLEECLVIPVGMQENVEPSMGAMPGIKAFTAAVIGGIGSIPGARLGGILLGVIESISYSIPALAPYTDAVEFAILIIVLLVKPSGILGKMRREKV